MKEYKDEILSISQKHHIDETIKIINKEIDTKLSYKWCRSLLKQTQLN